MNVDPSSEPPIREMTKHELTQMYLPPKRNHSRRKRKPLGPHDLTPETVPLNDIRRTYPEVFASLTSRSGIEEVRAQLGKIVAGDDFSFVITTVEGENPFGPVYRENKGLEASARFLSAYFQAIPDCIFKHTNLQFFKRKTGSSVLKTDFTMSGCMVFKVVVDNADQADDFTGAVQGLQGLQSASSAPSDSSAAAPPSNESIENEVESMDSDNNEEEGGGGGGLEEEEVEEDEIIPTSKRPRLLGNVGGGGDGDSFDNKSISSGGIPRSASLDSSSHTPGWNVSIISKAPEVDTSNIINQDLRPATAAANKKTVQLGDTEVVIDSHEDESAYRNMLITSDATNYQLGQRSEGRNFATIGRMIFYMNKEKKLVKIDAQYSAKKTLESCKYDSLTDYGSSSDSFKDDVFPPLSLTGVEGLSSDDEGTDDISEPSDAVN